MHKNIDGFTCYAPELLQDSSHFPKENFGDLYALEKGHFWFESRNTLIEYFVEKYLKGQKSFLEIGCGTGFVLERLSKSKSFVLSGSELFLEGLKFARARSPHIDFFQADARSLPFENKYNAIGAFDVLEHIQEDEDVLKSCFKALKSKGFIFISVPQHMWLWSVQDEVACHKRRYTRQALCAKLRGAGFEIKETTSFVTTLLPAMLLSRLGKKNEKDVLSELKIHPILNKIFRMGMKFDHFLITRGFPLPVGGSLFMVGQKS